MKKERERKRKLQAKIQILNTYIRNQGVYKELNKAAGSCGILIAVHAYCNSDNILRIHVLLVSK